MIDYVQENFPPTIIDFTQITDANIALLNSCRTINLAGCAQITDPNIALLNSCRTINLAAFARKTDAALPVNSKTVDSQKLSLCSF